MSELATPRASFGIEGLDQILEGGVPRNTLFLVQGPPGSGKTTLSIQFLIAGVRSGERCLFVTNGESRAETRASTRLAAGASTCPWRRRKGAPWRGSRMKGAA